MSAEEIAAVRAAWSSQDVRTLIGEVMSIPAAELADDVDFIDHYGLDSLGVIELLAALERKYRLVLPDEKVERLRTVRGVMDVLTEALGPAPTSN